MSHEKKFFIENLKKIRTILKFNDVSNCFINIFLNIQTIKNANNTTVNKKFYLRLYVLHIKLEKNYIVKVYSSITKINLRILLKPPCD